MTSEVLEGLVRAVELIAGADAELLEITLRSLAVSGLATLISATWSIPLGALLGLRSFRGRTFARALFNASMGVPTVTLGLILYLLLSRAGPLGQLGLLYTPWAVVIGQSLLVTPIIVSLVASAVEAVDPEIRSLALTLGASEAAASLAVLGEALGGVLLAVVSSFNRAVSELGIALMVGGNIRGWTRVLTTSIALEVRRGELALSIALAIVLILVVSALSLGVNLARRGR